MVVPVYNCPLSKSRTKSLKILPRVTLDLYSSFTPLYVGPLQQGQSAVCNICVGVTQSQGHRME